MTESIDDLIQTYEKLLEHEGYPYTRPIKELITSEREKLGEELEGIRNQLLTKPIRG